MSPFVLVDSLEMLQRMVPWKAVNTVLTQSSCALGRYNEQKKEKKRKWIGGKKLRWRGRTMYRYCRKRSWFGA
jgi:hypothetical protein